ncbi:chemotaxis protein CheB [Paludibaculum fermentans]|uniref:chemotaxis protein CheB n=1 Tax=Paludibaculum fermentans TaxID=1473598 RepID=UPI003EC007B4
MTRKAATKPPTPAKPENQLLPVVGIGASAGGSEAFTALLKHLPPDSGMAFVLIQHLDPNQHSQLSELLSKACRMPVQEVVADTAVSPDHVYVISPGVCLSLSNDHLRVEQREPGLNLPIDHFLLSLAREKSSNAIGIVLSGTASDGSLGLKAIKAEGGITFAQEPASAKFEGMPRSAIAAGVVDFILPPAEIAKRVVRLAQHPYVARKSDQAEEAGQAAEVELNRIFRLLRGATGTDFAHYKSPTIRRRLHRRMVLHGSEKLSDYVAYLQENPAEVRALADDLLICVTFFFREPEAFQALVDRVFPRLLKDRSTEEPIRIWVPGCATGEEVYSLAICLAEAMDRSAASVPVQIFATDISETALDRARAGIYGTPSLAGISPARLKQFFTKANGGHQIKKFIRETCVFAKQDITKDPPFHNLDLISCCNVLIYFGPILQRKALSIFHYALKPEGVLMLGSSEGVSALPDAFAPLEKKIKLFSKASVPRSLKVRFPSTAPLTPVASSRDLTNEGARGTADVQKTAERLLLAQYAPAGVLVDDALNVVHVRGDTGPFLHLAPGEPSYNLLRMAREGLVVSLRTAFAKVRRMKGTITQAAQVKQNGQFKEVHLRLIPITAPARPSAPHFMVLFENATLAAPAGAVLEESQPAGAAKTARAGGPRSQRENTRLRQELAATREYLQSIIEEQEAFTEELKSANEEAQASNEELETAREELQSANEELNTVNEELRSRNVELMAVNNDLSNVLTSITVPLVMVGKDLKIRRFTPAMEPMLNFIDSDIGRSISDLKPNIDVPDLEELLSHAIKGGTPAGREVQGPDGTWYSMQAVPYRVDNQIEGALLVLHDIDLVRHGRDYAEAVVEATRQPLIILNKDLKVRSANRAFYEMFEVSKDETENRFIYDLGNGQWNIPKLREALQKIVPGAGGFRNFEIEHEFERIGRKTMVLNAREVRQPAPYGQTILLAIEDITDRIVHRQLEGELARTTRALTVGALAASIAHEINQPLAGVVTNAQAGLRWLDAATPNVHEAQESLALIVRDGNRASEVISRMRDFLKKDDPGMVAFDINESVQAAIAFANGDLKKGGIVLRAELSNRPLLVRGNPIQLQQVVLNLIMNSRDALVPITNGSRDLLVSSQKIMGPRGHSYLLVTVRDSGVGISQRDMERMFDGFFTTKPNGMGLGLSISRSIIEAHGGRIWASLNEGPGLTIQFSVPAEGEKHP